MAKGAKKTAENTATAIGQSATGQQNLASSQAGQSYAAMMPQIYQMLSSGGDPAVTTATMGALGSTFGAARQNVMDTATRTNNGASTNASLDQLARTQGAQGAQAAANNVASQHQQATQLLSKIWGMSQDQVAKMLAERTGANNSYNSAAGIKGVGSATLGIPGVASVGVGF